MSIRTFFSIFLKIIGIFLLKDLLITIVTILSSLFSVMTPFKSSVNSSSSMLTLTTIVAIFIFYIALIYFCIFKPDFIIDKLKLDRGFDREYIHLNVHRSTILSISVIVIGGYIVANEIPNLCRQLCTYYQERRIGYGSIDPNISYSIMSAAKIMIGLLLIGNQRQIVNFIEYKRKK